MPKPPLCKMCGKEMEEIGETGSNLHFGRDPDGERYIKGANQVMLYQCPEDKTIAVN